MCLAGLPALASAICLLACRSGVHSPQTPSGLTFKLARTAMVSTGVFDEHGALVRTLSANENLPAGAYRKTWDGKDDTGKAAPAGNFTFKAISHNLAIRWEGTIGSTSTDRTGATPFHGIGTVLDVLSLKGDDYLLRDYNEQMEWVTREPHDDPGRFYPSGQRFTGTFSFDLLDHYMASSFATDGSLIYVAMTAIPPLFKGGGNNFILKYDPDDETASALKPFTSVPPIKGLDTGQNNAGKWLVVNAPADLASTVINSIAIQRSGNVMAVAMHGAGKIVFYDKDSGAQLPQPPIALAGVTVVKWSPDGQTLWCADDQTNSVRPWRASGGAWAAGPSINPGSAVVGFEIRPSDGALAVMVGGTIQQVKVFSPGGQPLQTIGQTGGYSTVPDVLPDRFAFLPLSPPPANFAYGAPLTFGGLCYEPDGFLRVLDSGNNRIQTFGKDGAYRSTVSWVPGICYTQTTDRTDATRIFAGYSEYARDYSVSLVHHSDGSGGAWKLVRNWEYIRLPDGSKMGLPTSRIGGSRDGLMQVVTCPVGFAQGRTFGILFAKTRNKVDFVELDPKQGLIYRSSFDAPRFPGYATFAPAGRFELVQRLSLLPDKEGIRVMGTYVDAKDRVETIYEQKLTAIDQGVAKWSPPAPYASVSYDAPAEVPYKGAQPIGGGIELLSDGSLVTASNLDTMTEGRPYIGILPAGGTATVNQFARSGYNVPMRRDGTVPISFPGMHPAIPSGGVRVANDVIAQFDHGEWVDSTETNQILLFHRSGLPLGQTGQRRRMDLLPMAVTSGAGGSFNGNAVNTLPNGDLVIHVNSESMQGGIGEISVRNVRSIRESSAPIAGNSADLGDITPPGDWSEDSAPAYANVFHEDFARPDSESIGNGWNDLSGRYRIQGKRLRVRDNANDRRGDLGSVLARSIPPVLSNEQTLRIPAIWSDPTKIAMDANGSRYMIGLVGRLASNTSIPPSRRDAYFVEVVYVKGAAWKDWRANGTIMITIMERRIVPGVGPVNFLLATDNWDQLPPAPGHSYVLTFRVKGRAPTILDATLQDEATGRRAVLHAENDEPSLQQPGLVGLFGRVPGTTVVGDGAEYTLKY